MSKTAAVLGTLIALGVGVAAGFYLPSFLNPPAPPKASAPAAPVTPVAPAAPRAMVVEAAIVETVLFPRGLTAVGSLRSEESVVLRSEVVGRIKEINFKEGSPVAKGQVLFRLDDAVARAELEQVKANLSLSQSQSNRASSLHAEGYVSKQFRDEAANALKVQQAAVQLAQARLDKTVINAPFDGVVGLRSVSVGDYVSAGQDLAPLEAIRLLKADFRLPELYVSKVQLGQRIELRFDALPGKTRFGEVYAISPLVDAGGRSILVRALVANQDGLLRPGMFARIQLLVQEGKALVVPEAAVVSSGQGHLVYRIEDGRAVRTDITIGERRDGLVEVLMGLDDGDQVLVAGLQRVQNNAPVKVTGKPMSAREAASKAGDVPSAGIGGVNPASAGASAASSPAAAPAPMSVTTPTSAPTPVQAGGAAAAKSQPAK